LCFIFPPENLSTEPWKKWFCVFKLRIRMTGGGGSGRREEGKRGGMIINYEKKN